MNKPTQNNPPRAAQAEPPGAAWLKTDGSMWGSQQVLELLRQEAAKPRSRQRMVYACLINTPNQDVAGPWSAIELIRENDGRPADQVAMANNATLGKPADGIVLGPPLFGELGLGDKYEFAFIVLCRRRGLPSHTQALWLQGMREADYVWVQAEAEGHPYETLTVGQLRALVKPFADDGCLHLVHGYGTPIACPRHFMAIGDVRRWLDGNPDDGLVYLPFKDKPTHGYAVADPGQFPVDHVGHALANVGGKRQSHVLYLLTQVSVLPPK